MMSRIFRRFCCGINVQRIYIKRFANEIANGVIGEAELQISRILI